MRSVQRTCKICGEIKTITAPESEFCAWESGQLIQRAMKSLREGDRELLISGTCGPCFDKMFFDKMFEEFDDAGDTGDEQAF